jgi:crossover junction endodeoxyribonuclease RuvC
MRILGIDPGLGHTGWGIIDHVGSRLSFVAAGIIEAKTTLDMAERLKFIHDEMHIIIKQYQPITAAIEETFVNTNAKSSLKLGQARGVAMLVPAIHGIDVSEYAANLVKKSVVGSGHAGKEQVQMMIKILLPSCGEVGADAADALSVAICHAHHRHSNDLILRQQLGQKR